MEQLGSLEPWYIRRCACECSNHFDPANTSFCGSVAIMAFEDGNVTSRAGQQLENRIPFNPSNNKKMSYIIPRKFHLKELPVVSGCLGIVGSLQHSSVLVGARWCTHTLAECASAGGVVFKDGFVVNALRELSVGLCRSNCVLYKRSLCALARVSGTAFRADAAAPLSVQMRHPKLFKDFFFPFVLIVFQPLLGAVLLHSLCCNTLIKSPR